MVKNKKKLRQFEQKLSASSSSRYHHNVKIANALLRMAKKRGKFPPKNKLDDIEIDIRYAKAINSV